MQTPTQEGWFSYIRYIKGGFKARSVSKEGYFVDESAVYQEENKKDVEKNNTVL